MPNEIVALNNCDYLPNILLPFLSSLFLVLGSSSQKQFTWCQKDLLRGRIFLPLSEEDPSARDKYIPRLHVN